MTEVTDLIDPTNYDNIKYQVSRTTESKVRYSTLMVDLANKKLKSTQRTRLQDTV